MSEHTDALKATYGITTTFIRREGRWLAERTHDGTTHRARGSTEAAAVQAVLAGAR